MMCKIGEPTGHMGPKWYGEATLRRKELKLPSVGESAARQYLDGLNALDVDQIIDAISPDAVIRYPGLGVTDRHAFRAYVEQVVAILSKFEIEDQEMFTTENGVAARWSFDATLRSGRTAHCEGIDSWVVGQDGKIEVLDVYYDPTPLREALAE